jgi:uracil-DNA glycosylase
MTTTARTAELETVLASIRACRCCVEAPQGKPLPHEPRPVLRASSTARLAVCSQAPGTKVHASGTPFTDRSGDRLRDWMGVGPREFYDESRVAIVPMGFCFPGQDANGADLPPRRECAPLWQPRFRAALPNIELTLLVGSYAQNYYLSSLRKASLAETVRAYREYLPEFFVLPHPSWRNIGWRKKNPWFAKDVLPALRKALARMFPTV